MKLYRRTYPTGHVVWELNYGVVGGKRKRVAYQDQASAEKALADAIDARTKHGTLAPYITPADVAELATVRQRLDGASLTAAVEFYLTNKRTGPPSPIALPSAIAAFHIVLYERGRSSRTRETLRSVLNPIALRHPNLALHHLTRDHISTWLRANRWAPRTQRGYLGHIRTFLNWARHEGHITDDPTRGIVISQPATADTGTLSVDDCEKLLRAAIAPPAPDSPPKRSFIGYIALAMFCGLRRAELQRLTWREVRLDEKLVIVSAGHAKTRMRRVVDIPTNAIPWLQLDPAHGTQKRISPARFKENWKTFRQTAGITAWPHNALRHTYASMHYAIHQNENILASQMGNSPVMVHRHYRALVTAKEAERFWKLSP